ncbi:hypothetical protein [Calothrix sp. CCY 0018]|uniref:hypothetical protein n=1 Tax=Calothrix sp. CCY 0018 TaxID=3103864 RepID=UPI0039C5C79F
MSLRTPRIFSISPKRYPSSNSISNLSLWIVAIAIAVFNAITNPSFTSFAILILGIFATITIAWRHNLNGLFTFLEKLSRYYRLSTPIFVICGTFFLLNALSTPAQAQFFQNAETWMTGQFTGAGEAIPLVFNVLRGLFLIYLGISLVKVIQASRQDEDWQNLARTPMIILIAVTVGDILANLIIGGGGGGAAPGG